MQSNKLDDDDGDDDSYGDVNSMGEAEIERQRRPEASR